MICDRTSFPSDDDTLIIFNEFSSTAFSHRYDTSFYPSISIRFRPLANDQDKMKENEPLRQQRRTRSKYRHLTISNIYPLYDFDSRCSTPVNSSDFFYELTELKQRLDLLEKEREVLENKVRQYHTENSLYNCYYNEFNEVNLSRRPSATVVDKDIDRLKQRIALLVKSNDEKEKKIEDLQNRLGKNLNCRDSYRTSQLMNTEEIAPIEKLLDDTDGEISDGNSVPSLRSDNESQFPQPNKTNSYRNPLNRLKLNVLQRASSVEPMMQNRQMNDILIQQQRSSKCVERTGGYVSDGADKRNSNRKGFKSLFGKIIRTPSNSSSHSTVTNRSSRLIENENRYFDSKFSQWEIDQIISWLYTIDLDQYAAEFRKYFRNGFELLQATQTDLEKKIGMKNPLHRKKLQLYLNTFTRTIVEPIHLDLRWIQKWLDDIGLPQYKESFFDSKVDGRVLNNLTLDDAVFLNVHHEIHYSTIKHSIQVLRMNHFDPNYIRRRPNLDDDNEPTEILRWSNHRVMDWLRSIDLAEFAPNLRGSGVCGALMIFESRFNASTLAEILSIPTSKTLLRRHLTKSFEELIGLDIQNRKNQYEKSFRCPTLTRHSKIKIPRRLFSSQRRTSSVDLVCPIDDKEIDSNFPSNLSNFPQKNDQLFSVCDNPTSFV